MEDQNDSTNWIKVSELNACPIPCAPTRDSIALTSCETYESPSGNFIWTESGIYKDTLENAGGCDSVLTINLTIINLDTAVTVSANNITSSDTLVSFQWLDCNTNTELNNATSKPFTATSTGSYAVS